MPTDGDRQLASATICIAALAALANTHASLLAIAIPEVWCVQDLLRQLFKRLLHAVFCLGAGDIGAAQSDIAKDPEGANVACGGDGWARLPLVSWTHLASMKSMLCSRAQANPSSVDTSRGMSILLPMSIFTVLASVLYTSASFSHIAMCSNVALRPTS